MTKGDLAKWRFKAPWVISVTCVLPYFFLTNRTLADLNILNTVVVTFVATIAAAIYLGFDLRRAPWNAELDAHVRPQIKSALIAMIPHDLEVSDEERAALARGEVFGEIRGVFWEAIDRDPHLAGQKEHFFTNGAVYTTIVDAYQLAALFAILYVVAHFVRGTPQALVVAAVLLGVSLVSRLVALPKIRARHLMLSKEQLVGLEQSQSDFIAERFREIVVVRRRAGLLGKQ